MQRTQHALGLPSRRRQTRAFDPTGPPGRPHARPAHALSPGATGAW